MNIYNATMMKLRDKIPPRMKALPVTEDGWPQLWFASITKEGKPDLRCADPEKRVRCVKKRQCWLCGQPLGSFLCFVLGPMCTITRTTSEPACHRECAEFAVVSCPFLSKPKMKRNEAEMPDGYREAPGLTIKRNPGVSAIWITKSFRLFNVEDGWLIRVGNPTEVLWYAEGRRAYRDEVLESINSGYPLLRQEAELQGTESVSQLAMQRKQAEAYLPALDAGRLVPHHGSGPVHV